MAGTLFLERQYCSMCARHKGELLPPEPLETNDLEFVSLPVRPAKIVKGEEVEVMEPSSSSTITSQ